MVDALYFSTFVIPNQLIFGYDALLQLLRFEPMKLVEHIDRSDIIFHLGVCDILPLEIQQDTTLGD